MSSPNPYASPATETLAASAIPNHLQIAQRIYWWIGLVGTAACVLFVAFWLVGAAAGIFSMRHEDLTSLLPLTAGVCFHALLFNYFRITANRLFSDPARYRRRSRLVGFAMATLYFPILTVPGLFCVWKIDKHFEESSQRVSKLPLHGMPT